MDRCRLILGGALLLLSAVGSAQAQPMRRMERDASRGDVARSAHQLHDDLRDLQNFRATLASFDMAWQRRDAAGVNAALQSFVSQGRAEVAEQQRETMQAQNEAQRSNWEARRDRTWKDARDARDDRRDAREERQELRQEIATLNDLERAVAATYQWGPNTPALMNARQAMQRFIRLAEQEVRRSRRELREDQRELREDQRAVRRGYAPPPPGYVAPAPQPMYGQPPPPAGYVAPAPQPVYTQPAAVVPTPPSAPPTRAPAYNPAAAQPQPAPPPPGYGQPAPRPGAGL